MAAECLLNFIRRYSIAHSLSFRSTEIDRLHVRRVADAGPLQAARVVA